MIDFACSCGQRFSLDSDQAGRSVQCPQCRRLIDVPSLEQLPALNDDGTYAVAPAQGPVHSAPAADPRDLHYDPETGQPIEPLPLKHYDGDRIHAPIDDEGHAIPVATALPDALNYARVPPAPRSFGGRLFHPRVVTNVGNGLTLFFVYLASLLAIAGIGIMFGSCGLASLFVSIVVMPAALGYYCLVIQHMGPDGFDELPRLFRNADFWEDYVLPCLQVMQSWILAYGPAIALGIGWIVTGDVSLLIFAALIGLAAGLIAPAIMLTVCTSGAYVNLSPPRLRGAIARCGRPYWIAALVWSLTFLLYVVCNALVFTQMQLVLEPLKFDGRIFGIGCAGLGLAVVCMIYACSRMAMLYRYHHEEFPWLFQRHERQLEEVSPEVQARRAAQRQLNESRSKRYTRGTHSPGI